MPYRVLCNNVLPSARLIPVAHVSCSSCALPHQQIRPWLLLKNTVHLPLPRDIKSGTLPRASLMLALAHFNSSQFLDASGSIFHTNPSIGKTQRMGDETLVIHFLPRSQR